MACLLAGLNADLAGANPAFFSPNTLTDSAPFLRQAQSATSLLSIAHSDHAAQSDWCTATFVSPRGYALTALHCLRQTGLLTSENLPGPPGNPVWVRRRLTPRQLLEQQIVLSTISLPLLGVQGAKLIFLGKGYSPRLPNIDADLNAATGLLGTAEDLRLTREFSEDFAVLKFEINSEHSQPLCLRSTHAPQIGQVLWALGYPLLTAGQIPEQPYATSGVELPSMSAIPAIQDRHFTDPTLSNINRYYLPMGIHLAELPGAPGMSGSPIVNRMGSLTGIMTDILLPECFGSESFSRYYSVQVIRQKIRTALGHQWEAEIFGCAHTN